MIRLFIDPRPKYEPSALMEVEVEMLQVGPTFIQIIELDWTLFTNLPVTPCGHMHQKPEGNKGLIEQLPKLHGFFPFCQHKENGGVVVRKWLVTDLTQSGQSGKFWVSLQLWPTKWIFLQYKKIFQINYSTCPTSCAQAIVTCVV